jgi:FG-GAP-like repeat/FG-GAP repeat
MIGRGLVWGALVLLCMSRAFAAATVSFQTERSYSVGTNPKAVAFGDFNHDGKGDLAVVNYGDPTTGDDGSVSLLFGKGDGTVQAAKNVAIGKNCTSLVAGDLNGDGNDDFALLRPGDATVGDDGDVIIFLGNGDGTFRQGQVLTPGKNPSSDKRAIIAVDLNADQRLDLVVANAGDKTFTVLLGNGDGTFQLPVAYPVSNAPSSVLAVDLAGNGDKDLAVSSGINVDIWLSNRDGTFRQGSTFSGNFYTLGYFAGDFNADKKGDLVERRSPFCLPPPCQASQANLSLGNGDATFQPPISIGQSVSAAADFDGDDKLDVVGGGSPQLLVMQGNGDGTFQQPLMFAINSNELLAAAVDVNLDKATDLVLIGQNSVSLLINVGTDFSISASALNPSALNRGQGATSTISLSLLSAFDNPVSLACSVQPAQAGAPTCSLSSNSVTFDGSGKSSAMLTINAGSSAASLNLAGVSRKPGWLWFPVAGFAFLGTGVGLSRRRRLLVVLLGTALFTGLIAQLACGGRGGGPKSTVYTVTVTGASGATQHSTTVNLIVQ